MAVRPLCMSICLSSVYFATETSRHRYSADLQHLGKFAAMLAVGKDPARSCMPSRLCRSWAELAECQTAPRTEVARLSHEHDGRYANEGLGLECAGVSPTLPRFTRILRGITGGLRAICQNTGAHSESLSIPAETVKLFPFDVLPEILDWSGKSGVGFKGSTNLLCSGN